eukprot:TRINITY_DN13588_c0_g1_i2.p1 TRINITY_DN13588_c0_g1~~TRINITY_DN13588_c0_g1_i2.p1  ORF type:complete len:233 (+),score=78.40 TRINITY_DN13588_c0_g1_i2:56-754(+)
MLSSLMKRSRLSKTEEGSQLTLDEVVRENSASFSSGYDSESESEGEAWVRNAGFSLMVPVGSCVADELRNSQKEKEKVETAEMGCQTDPKFTMEREAENLREQVKRLQLEAKATEMYYANKDTVIEMQRAMIKNLQEAASRNAAQERTFAASLSSPGESSKGSPSGNSSEDDEYDSDTSSEEEDNEQQVAIKQLEIRRPVIPLVRTSQIEKHSPMRRTPSASHGAAFGMIHY